MTVKNLPLVPAVAKFPVVNYFNVRYFLKEDGSIWFVGKDVAEILGYVNPRDALAMHVDDEDKQIIQKSENATLEIPNRGLTIINESGLYSLIFGSKLPSAKEFKRWVTAEVLPSLRKYGKYEMPKAEIVETLPADDEIKGVANRDGISDSEIEFAREKFVIDAWKWLEEVGDVEKLSLAEQAVLFQWVVFVYENFLNPIEISAYELAQKMGSDHRTIKRAILKLTQKKLFPPPFTLQDVI